MTKVTKEITFDAAHMLGGYEGKCRNLHGHTYRLQAEACGETDAGGMVVDFYALKRAMAELVDERYDHAYLYDERNESERELAAFLEARGLRTCALPFRTTSENLARRIFSELAPRVPICAIRLWETPTSCAVYAPPNGKTAAGSD